jgi:hypothetical protein
MKAVGSGGNDGENDGDIDAVNDGDIDAVNDGDIDADNDVAAESPVNAKADEGKPNPRVSRAVVVGDGPLGGAGAGGRDLLRTGLKPPVTPPVGGGGPVGPGAEN